MKKEKMRFLCWSIIIFLMIVNSAIIQAKDGDAYYCIGSKKSPPHNLDLYGVYKIGQEPGEVTRRIMSSNNGGAGVNPVLDDYLYGVCAQRDGKLAITYMESHEFSPDQYGYATPHNFNYSGANMRQILQDNIAKEAANPGSSCYSEELLEPGPGLGKKDPMKWIWDKDNKTAYHWAEGSDLDGVNFGGSVGHDWEYHVKQLGGVGAGNGAADCYIHSCDKTNPVTGAVGPGREFDEAGGAWIPVGPWFHNNAAGRSWQIYEAKVCDAMASLTRFYNEDPIRSDANYPNWNGNFKEDIKTDPAFVKIARATGMKFRNACGDPCGGANYNTPINVDLSRAPFAMIMAPSGRIYTLSPYANDGIWVKRTPLPVVETGPDGKPKLKEFTNADFQPFLAQTDIDGGEDAYLTANHIIKVPPGTWDISKEIAYIGFATKDLDNDWIYISNQKDFAVADQFDGKGGIAYTLDENSVCKKYVHRAGGPLNEETVSPANLGSEKIIKIGSDGVGNLYFFTSKIDPAQNWDYKRGPDNQPLININDPANFHSIWKTDDKNRIFYDSKIESELTQQQKDNLFEVELDIQRPYAFKLYKVEFDDASQTAQVMGDAVAGNEYGKGLAWMVSPTGEASTPLPTPMPRFINTTGGTGPGIDLTVDLSQTDDNLDLSVVVDAGVGQSGDSITDIYAEYDGDKFKQDETDKNADIIETEDIGGTGSQEWTKVYSWYFENYDMDFDWTNAPAPITDPALRSKRDKYVSRYKVGDPAYPYGTSYQNALKANINTQEFVETDKNDNDVKGGWSNNIVADCADTNKSSVQYRWAVIMQKKGGLTSDKGKVENLEKKPNNDPSDYSVYVNDPENKKPETADLQNVTMDDEEFELASEAGVANTGYKLLYLSKWCDHGTSPSIKNAVTDANKTHDLDAGAGRGVKEGYRFDWSFKDSGVYYVLMQSRFHVYDYQRAGIAPEFMKAPEENMDIGEDRWGIEYTDPDQNANGAIRLPRSIAENPANEAKEVAGKRATWFVGKPAFSPPFTLADFTPYADDFFREDYFTARKVIVGKKTPDVNTYAACEIYLEGSATTEVFGTFVEKNGKKIGDEIDDIVEITEDIPFKIKANAWIKYWRNIDEEYLYGKKSSLAGGEIQQGDTKVSDGLLSRFNFSEGSSDSDSYNVQAMKDMFSGVVPGTVRFFVTIEKGGGTPSKSYSVFTTKMGLNTENLPVTASEITSDDNSGQSLVPITDVAGLDIKKDVDPKVIYIIRSDSDLTKPKTNALTDCFPGYNEIENIDDNAQYEYKRGTVDHVNKGDSIPSQFFPKGSLLAEFLEIGGSNEIVWETPSVGRPKHVDYGGISGFEAKMDPPFSYLKTTLDATDPLTGKVHPEKDDVFVIRLVTRGTVRRYDPNDASTVIWANPPVAGTLTGDINAVKSEITTNKNKILGFKPVADEDQVISEDYLYVKVHDVTLPEVKLEVKGDSKAGTGDPLNSYVVCTVKDNNPYLSSDSVKDITGLIRYFVLPDDATYDGIPKITYTFDSVNKTITGAPTNRGPQPKGDFWTHDGFKIPAGMTKGTWGLKADCRPNIGEEAAGVEPSGLTLENGDDSVQTSGGIVLGDKYHVKFEFRYDSSPDNTNSKMVMAPDNAGKLYFVAGGRDASGNCYFTGGSASPTDDVLEFPESDSITSNDELITKSGPAQQPAKVADAGQPTAIASIDIVDNDPPRIYIQFDSENMMHTVLAVSDTKLVGDSDKLGEYANSIGHKDLINNIHTSVTTLDTTFIDSGTGFKADSSIVKYGISTDMLQSSFYDKIETDGSLSNPKDGNESTIVYCDVLDESVADAFKAYHFVDAYYSSKLKTNGNDDEYEKFAVYLPVAAATAETYRKIYREVNGPDFTLLPPINASLGGSNLLDAIEIPEQTRTKVIFRADDNVDGVIEIDPAQLGNAINMSDDTPQSYVRSINNLYPIIGATESFGKDLDADYKGAMIIKSWRKTSDIPATDYDRLLYEVKDSAGNVRRVVVPYRIVEMKQKSITLEKD